MIGFVAGTLIHTRDGLRPIEQIQIGDLVLSRSNNKGDLLYKQVLKTFRGKETIWLVGFVLRGEKEGEQNANETFWCAMTWEQPFYLRGGAWLRVLDLQIGMEIVLMDGRSTVITAINPVYATRDPGVGWAPIGQPYWDTLKWPGGAIVRYWNKNFFPGHRVGLSYKTLQVNYAQYSNPKLTDSLLLRVVYNFHIQDNHTYFVGQLGFPVIDFPESRAQAIILDAYLRSDDIAVKERAITRATKMAQSWINVTHEETQTVPRYPEYLVQEIIHNASSLQVERADPTIYMRNVNRAEPTIEEEAK